ncbi:MAG TPA: efflux RND transporter periplasmic adaptor subunit [Rhodospirillales bacterium]|nr:efflux RND transporter periplasmic adaptor subunit [Rhodospirillales bacterium]
MIAKTLRPARTGAGPLLCILALVAVLAACRDDSHAQQQPEPPPAAVIVAPVEKVDINPRIEYVGQTVAVDTVDLRARVEATLVRRAFVEGDDVAAGTLLFGLERDPFEAAVEAAAARVAEQRAAVVRTRRDLERARTLYGQGNVSQQTLDRATADQQQADALLRASEADLRQAQIDLGYTQVTAPFDGRIGRSVYSVGQWVGPDSGVLATLVKLDPIYVVFNVSERRYLDYRLRVEQATREDKPTPAYVPRVRLSNGAEYGRPGRLTFVDNTVDPSTGTIAVRAEFANPEKLLVPGLFVTVLLDQAEAKPALLVPQAAVQEDQGGRFVLVVGEGDRVEVRRIDTGARIGIRWEVTSGLNEGERVIWEGIQKARPGAAVVPTVRLPASPTG